jgi:serine/threonine-protein phosphatase 2A regulatory subunit B''
LNIGFCLSEEDKTTETAIEYWFRCLDLHSDGNISEYEMKYFYEEQLSRMENVIPQEIIPFEDVLVQM